MVVRKSSITQSVATAEDLVRRSVVERPLLAIVTPTYNRIPGLRKLHESLREQTAPLAWVHVVVDDASDQVVEPTLVTDDASRLHIERSTLNGGPLLARNNAIEVALGYGADLVAFVDDDDFVVEDFFEYVLHVWNKERSVGWYVSRCRFLGEDSPGYHVWPSADGVYDWFDDMQLDRRFGADVCHVVSAARIQRVRFARRGRFQREWTFLARLARQGGFYASNRITKVSSYSPDGLTLSRRGLAPDFISCWNFVSKPAVLVLNRPNSARAWRMLIRQLAALPVRLCLLAVRTFSEKAGDLLRR